MSSEGNITVIESFSADDTHALGVTLGQQAKPGDVCTLVGDLGVGKTVLTQGIAEGLGITEPINSPTFTIVQVYEEGRLPFYHFDVYRIGDIRARHSRKSVHLTKIRYAHLKHRYLMAFPDSENGEWQAYLIVEIACGLVDAVFLLKD